MILKTRIIFFRIFYLIAKAIAKPFEATYFFGHRTKPVGLKDIEPLKCSGSHLTVGVVISLFNFMRYQRVLEESISGNCCPLNKFQIILVSPSDSEIRYVRELCKAFPNIKFSVSRSRISIYKAWNIAIRKLQSAGAELITNLNCDDLRRPGGICATAECFSKFAVDVIYGESVLISDQPALKWDRSLLELRRTNVGSFSLDDLLLRARNKPHCAPMWAISLHNKVGYFSEELLSSGDSEFWLRCLFKGSTFYNSGITTVAYFRNPEGLSSSLQSKGFSEWNKVLCKVRYFDTKQ